MARRIRMLVLGFSCTEISGYLDGAKTILEKRFPDIEIIRCGLGGLSPTVISPAYSALLDKWGEFTHVLLEISTSIYAWNAKETEAEALDLLADIMHVVTTSRASLAFLVLPRFEVVNLKLNWNAMIHSEAGKYGYPVIDLAEPVIAERGEGFVRSMLRDNVHTTNEGSEYQATHVASGILDWLNLDRPQPISSPPLSYRAWLRFAHLDASKAVATFSRRDFSVECLRLKSDEVFVHKLRPPVFADSIAFVYGPWAGEFLLSINGGPPSSSSALDERSYYERLGVRTFPGLFVESIEITQTSRRPNITMIKGDIAPGKPEGRFFGLATHSQKGSPKV